MPIVGGLDIHRKQITFDHLDTETGQVRRGQISPADREHLRAWLARFAGRDDVAFAVEGCTGWRYVAEELAAAVPAASTARTRAVTALPGPSRAGHAGRELAAAHPVSVTVMTSFPRACPARRSRMASGAWSSG